MVERNSPVVIGIVLATLGVFWLVLRAVTVWAAPPSTGPRRRLPMFGSSEAEVDMDSGDEGAHHSSVDHSGDAGGHGGDAGDGGSGH